MNFSHPSPFGLALPSTASGSVSTSFQSSPAASGSGQPAPKRRKVKSRPSLVSSSSKNQLDLGRELDENDDIDEGELIAAPAHRPSRKIDDDYDEEDGEESASEDEEGDDDVGDEGEEGDIGVDEGAAGEEDDLGTEEAGAGVGKAKGGGSGGISTAKGEGPAHTKVKGKGKEKVAISEEPETLKRRRERLGQVIVDGKDVERRNKKRKEDTLNHMDPDQARRFDAFQTVVLPKQAIKRLNREMFDQSCNTNLAAIIAGLGKVFVAEVIEIAKEIQPTSKYPTGPLRPYHLRLARMELEQRGLLSPNGSGASRAGGSALRPKKAIFRR